VWKIKHFWRWTPPPGHEDQPVIDWWVEQVAINLTMLVYIRAEASKNHQTLERLATVFLAGAMAERSAVTEMEKRRG
jgi:hypothetical protein